MSQSNIDFGAFPDDPSADAIRTAFQKVQNNFNELYTTTSSTVLSVNRTAGAGITVNQPVGNVVLNANVYQVNFSSGTLRIGTAPNPVTSYANYVSGSQTLYIELPNVVSFYDITASNSVSITGNLSVTGNIVTDTITANYISGDGGNLSNITATVTGITNGTSNISIPTSNGDITFTANSVTDVVVISNVGMNINGSLSSTGNAIIPNVSVTDTLIANVYNGNTFSISGNVSAGNISINGLSNFTGSTQVYNLDSTGNIYANSGKIGAAYLVGTVETASQPNITSLGILSSLSVSGTANFTGTVNTGNITSSETVSANYFSGDGGGLSNLNVAAGTYIELEPSLGNITGNVVIENDGNVIISSLNTANVVKINNTESNFTGNLNVTGNATFGNINSVSKINAVTLTGTLTTASQPNITNLGALNSLSVNGLSNLGPASNLKISGGGANYFLMTDGSSNISWNDGTLKPVSGSNTQVQFNDNGAFGATANFTFNKTTNVLSVNGTINAGNLGGSLTTAAQPNITSIGTLTQLIVNGNIGGINQTLSGNLSVSGNITGNTIFRAAGTNAVPLLSTIKMRQFVNVDDFGAVGDGSTDDTAAVQDALNTGAKFIQFTQGKTYIVEALQSATADRVIQAYGATIKLKNNATTHRILRVTSTGNNTQILGGIWDGNKSNNTLGASMVLIEVYIASDGKISEATLTNSVNTGIKGYLTDRLLVENCIFTSISSPLNDAGTNTYYNSYGVYTETNSSHQDIYGNKVKNCYFDFTDSGTKGQPVLFTSSGGYTQYDWEISDNYVLGSTLSTNADLAICLAVRGDRGIVSNNTTIGGSMGWSEGGNDTVIEGNIFKDTIGSVRLGVEPTGARVIVTNNIISGHNIGISATSATNQSDCVISGNYIETDPTAASRFAIQIQPSIGAVMKDWTITGNRIKSRRGVQATRDVSGLVISGNYFEGENKSDTGSIAIQHDTAATSSVKYNINGNRFNKWYKILNFYTLESSPSPITDIIFNNNQVLDDNSVNSYTIVQTSSNAVLGSRILVFNNQINPTGNSFVWLYDQTAKRILSFDDSYITPEGNVTANIGSQYYNILGSGGTTLWLKESGNTSTGWTRIGSTQEFADGNVSNPSITNKGDTGTGIYFPAAASIGFTSNGTSVANLTSSGLQVANTISAGGNANVGNLNVASGGRISTVNGNANFQTTTVLIGQTSNSASTGTIRMIATGNAAYIQAGLNTDANSSANLIFTTISAGREWMRLDNNGNLGINNNAPQHTLVVGGTANVTGAATFNSTISAAGNISGANIITNNYVVMSTATGISAAGADQSGATSITKSINVVNIVSTGQGVRLPTPTAGTLIYITNTSANTLNVYPAVGGTIDSLSTNAPLTQASGNTTNYIAVSSTQWYSK